VFFSNGFPAVLPFTVKFEGGIPIGIIGITLHDLPSVVTPAAVQGLRFGDEVQAIDRTANLLDRLGIKTLIVTMHQGDGTLGGGPHACNVAPGIAQTIATTATPKVDAFFTGHSHQQYNCSVNDPAGNPRPVIQGLSFGRLLSVIDIKIDKKTRDVIRSATVADNVIVTRDVTQDPVVKKLVDDAVTKSAPIADTPVGSITADLVRAAPPSVSSRSAMSLRTRSSRPRYPTTRRSPSPIRAGFGRIWWSRRPAPRAPVWSPTARPLRCDRSRTSCRPSR